MNGHKRAFVWLVVVLSVALVAVLAGGAYLVVRERERAETEKRLAEAARRRLAEARRRAATSGLAWLGGRKAWVVTKTRPATDYCATLRRAGVTVRCAYATNKVNLHVLILRCPALSEARGRELMRHLGLDLRVNNWQRENACGKYHEITIYLND